MFGFGGKSFVPESDIPDQADRVFLVTGGKWLFTRHFVDTYLNES